jgi:hypothetical protein
MFSTDWDLVGRGFNGWHASTEDDSSVGCSFDVYLAQAKEGALIFDAADADRECFVRFIMRGPMCSPGLLPGTTEKFSENYSESAERMLPGLSGGFEGTVSRALNDKTYRGLDRVSLDIYENLLMTVPGMRVGHKRADKVEWLLVPEKA